MKRPYGFELKTSDFEPLCVLSDEWVSNGHWMIRIDKIWDSAELLNKIEEEIIIHKTTQQMEKVIPTEKLSPYHRTGLRLDLAQLYRAGSGGHTLWLSDHYVELLGKPHTVHWSGDERQSVQFDRNCYVMPMRSYDEDLARLVKGVRA